MPRPRKFRHIIGNPLITYYKPVGVPISSIEEVTISLDEFESLRLKDLEEMSQEQCAEKMDISQPTFHRIYTSARKKIADALVNGKSMRIEKKILDERGVEESNLDNNLEVEHQARFRGRGFGYGASRKHGMRFSK